MMKKSRVRRGAKILSIFLAVLFTTAIVCSCHLYDGEHKEFGQFSIVTGGTGEYATVIRWTWSGDPSDTVIEIPDTYDGKIAIDALGGPMGANAPLEHFVVVTDCDVKFVGDNPDKYGREVSFEEVVFTLKLGKNIEKAYVYYDNVNSDKYDYLPVEHDDGSVTFYKVYFNVEVSEENTKFYSEDGKMYETKNNTLVRFPYKEKE